MQPTIEPINTWLRISKAAPGHFPKWAIQYYCDDRLCQDEIAYATTAKVWLFTRSTQSWYPGMGQVLSMQGSREITAQQAVAMLKRGWKVFDNDK